MRDSPQEGLSRYRIWVFSLCCIPQTVLSSAHISMQWDFFVLLIDSFCFAVNNDRQTYSVLP